MGDGVRWEGAAFFGHALSNVGLLSAVDCRATLPERFPRACGGGARPPRAQADMRGY